MVWSGVSVHSRLDLLPDFDNVSGLGAAVHHRDASAGPEMRKQSGARGRDHRFMVQRVDGECFAGFRTCNQVVEVAVGIASPQSLYYRPVREN